MTKRVRAGFEPIRGEISSGTKRSCDGETSATGGGRVSVKGGSRPVGGRRKD